jgi:hypothetical protein
MADTFDTSRVGGGTYELEQDSNGNYKLKSVGFKQINKLNLPDLKSSDKSVADTTKKTTEDTTKTQTTEVFKPANIYDGGADQQDTSTPMLKTPEVKDVSVRSAGEMTNTTYNAMSDAEKNAIATGTATVDRQVETGAPGDNQFETVKEPMTFTGATGTETYTTPRTIADQNKYLGRTFTDKTTGLQKVTSKAKAATTEVTSAIKMAASAILPGANLVVSGLQAITPKETVVQKVNKGYFNTNEGSQRIAGNPATDLYAGMNRTSDFGNLENAGNKRIDTREKTIERKGVKSESNPNGVSQEFVANTEKMKDDASKYTAAKQKAVQGPAGGATTNSGSDNSSSDSGRVICTDLHRTGELSTRDWIRDTKFTFKTLSKTHVKGYLLWAEPTVKHMQKYPRYRKMWKHIAQHRANDIAWRLNEGKFDLLGRIYAGIGEPVCWVLGNFVSDKQISKYNLTHWRRA